MHTHCITGSIEVDIARSCEKLAFLTSLQSIDRNICMTFQSVYCVIEIEKETQNK